MRNCENRWRQTRLCVTGCRASFIFAASLSSHTFVVADCQQWENDWKFCGIPCVCDPTLSDVWREKNEWLGSIKPISCASFVAQSWMLIGDLGIKKQFACSKSLSRTNCLNLEHSRAHHEIRDNLQLCHCFEFRRKLLGLASEVTNYSNTIESVDIESRAMPTTLEQLFRLSSLCCCILWNRKAKLKVSTPIPYNSVLCAFNHKPIRAFVARQREIKEK